ncbi:MAG: DinB family protein [Pseudomonadota bacterium]
MITPEYCRTMAQYNHWQNQSLLSAADGIGESSRRAQRGAFFGSIWGTFNHLLWGDTIWMSRFDHGEKPNIGIPGSAEFTKSWEEFRTRRQEMDDRIVAWAEALGDGDLFGPLNWFSGAINAQVERPVALCVTHFFNHQTHHRGQVHAMLTAAGAKPDDTDLFVMQMS